MRCGCKSSHFVVGSVDARMLDCHALHYDIVLAHVNKGPKSFIFFTNYNVRNTFDAFLLDFMFFLFM